MAQRKQELGDRLGFHGGIDSVTTLPHGTLQQMVAEVQTRLHVLGAAGGYICVVRTTCSRTRRSPIF
jgi:hypothetical protein